MSPAAKNVSLLSACQALLMTSNSMLITTSALVGLALADDPALATLPLAVQFIAVVVVTYPASLLMRSIGRKQGLAVGALLGATGASLCTRGILWQSFGIFLLGSAGLGMFNAFGQYFRFAAADVAPADWRARAISLVMAGGVIAAFTGPNLARVTAGAWPGASFAASYLSLVGLSLLCAVVVWQVTIPGQEQHAPPAPGVVARLIGTPSYLLAVLAAVIAYTSMNLIMTSTPLAMHGLGFQLADTASVIQWHVLGMFAPAFFTGSLIERFGVMRVMIAGAVLMAGCVAVNLHGSGWLQFWLALLLLGVGWNFMFVGATTLLTTSYATSDKASAQGLNDFILFSSVALSALASGVLYVHLGWQTLNVLVLPGLALIALLGSWRGLYRRSARA